MHGPLIFMHARFNFLSGCGQPSVMEYVYIITIHNIITPRAQSVLSVSLSVSVCVSHQNFGLITTTKGLNASKRHSNNDNSEKTVHGVPEGG